MSAGAGTGDGRGRGLSASLGRIYAAFVKELNQKLGRKLLQGIGQKSHRQVFFPFPVFQFRWFDPQGALSRSCSGFPVTSSYSSIPTGGSP